MKVKSFLKRNLNPFTVILFAVLVLYVVSLFAILLWALMKSFQSETDFIMQGASVSAIPKEWTFANYIRAFDKIYYKLPMSKGGRTIYFGEMLMNSMFYAVGCALIATFVPLIVAYAVSRCKVWFNKVLNGMFFF